MHQHGLCRLPHAGESADGEKINIDCHKSKVSIKAATPMVPIMLKICHYKINNDSILPSIPASIPLVYKTQNGTEWSGTQSKLALISM